MAGEKVHFTKERETSLLNDHHTNEAIGKIDYDFSLPGSRWTKT